MHWVYLLKLENNKYYIGETRRLYRRFNEHINGDSVSCYDNRPLFLLAIYKVVNNQIYIDYSKLLTDKRPSTKVETENLGPFCVMEDINDIVEYNKELCSKYIIKEEALELENTITKMKMKVADNWKNVKGGQYCREDIQVNPISNYKFNRPLCNCPHNIPADIHIYNDKVYFRCSKKNMQWIDEEECPLSIPYQHTYCNFYLEVNKNNNYYNNKFITPLEKVNLETFAFIED